MIVRFACGHRADVNPDAPGFTTPQCPQCRETRVTVVDAPPPRITGIGSSPLKKG
jgi:hypothetical protein